MHFLVLILNKLSKCMNILSNDLLIQETLTNSEIYAPEKHSVLKHKDQ
jgi:hypothetical protein